MSGETFAKETLDADQKKPIAIQTKYVKLNVGGSLFYTTLSTLTKRADSMLRAMFSGRMEVQTDNEGRYWKRQERRALHAGVTNSCVVNKKSRVAKLPRC